MNQEIKDKWTKELRSGKYIQISGCLKNDLGFCCLGVLCNIYIEENKLTWKRNPDASYHFGPEKECGNLPVSVLNWAGLPYDHRYKFATQNVSVGSITLAELNDQGTSFTEIAQIIEERL